MGSKKYSWLLVDAVAALTDQVLDVLVLYEYATNEDWDLFGVGLGTILLPPLVLGVTGVFSPNINDQTRIIECTNFLPGINIVAHTARLMRAFLGEQFEGRDEMWAQRWFDKYEDDFLFARLAEATFEAAPQAVLQAFVALRRPEGVRSDVLYASLGFSLLSVSKTLVTALVLTKECDKRRVQLYEKESPLGHRERLRMFLLSVSYALCEVVSRVFSVAVLGYLCGGHSVAAALAAEYALYFVVVQAGRVRNRETSHPCNYWMLVVVPLLPQFTSLQCCDELAFREVLPLRLLVLAAYGAVTLTLDNNDARLTGDASVFFWTAAVATVVWTLLMPAFVNSCNNLDISFEYTHFKPNSFTKGCRYPLEVHADEDDNISNGSVCCGCIYNRQSGEVADRMTDMADNVAGGV